jgi:hypothetical protein
MHSQNQIKMRPYKTKIAVNFYLLLFNNCAFIFYSSYIVLQLDKN